MIESTERGAVRGRRSATPDVGIDVNAELAAVSMERDRLLEQLRFEAAHDELTGLPNRKRFAQLISRLPLPGAVLLVDLDCFSEVNEEHGHDHGDRLLRRVADRITAEFGRRAIVARIDGDEFAVLLGNVSAADASRDAVVLLELIEEPFEADGLQLMITASIGVAVADHADGLLQPGRLLQEADLALQMAKKARSGWERYVDDGHGGPRHPNGPSSSGRRRRGHLALATELRQAIEGDELVVHYQPKAHLSNGRVVGVEALVRWDRRGAGLMPPDDFIPLAERSGLIRHLTLRVLAAAAIQHRLLANLGFDVAVAVNLSVRSVLDANLPDQVTEVLERHGMKPSSLTLEITETSVMADPARTIGVLGRLAALGTTISIDDFGTGYSSLSYLKRLPAAEVKIDRSFISGMMTGRSDLAIVRSTVDLARDLGLQAVAEGVEDAGTWEALDQMGCHQAQGYHLSPALPADALSDWLQQRHAASGTDSALIAESPEETPA